MAISELHFEPNGLYILLSDRGNTYSFHWGLYLSKTPETGILFHLINPDTTTRTKWKYELEQTHNIADSRPVLLALKIGELDPVLHTALAHRLEQVSIEYSCRYRESMSCRIWVKEALFALDDEGFIQLTRAVGDIETEARLLAIRNKCKCERSVANSRGCVV